MVHIIKLSTEASEGGDQTVTKDFPTETLKPFYIEAKSTDDFICDCIDLDEKKAMLTINTMCKRFKLPEYDWESLTRKAEAQGLIRTSSAMEKYKSVF